jgi:iron complex outermembrane receptor protein
MHNRNLKLATKLVAATSVLALSAPALAQDEATVEEGTGVGNSVIVVTAQKKSQNLQDVPISISAFDSEALEAARIEGIEDIGTLTPGLYITPNPADNNGVRLNIRGVGTFDPQVGQDSRVAIYIDGVYVGKSQGLAFDSPDLERIEVVKGPQGTLYGRNAVAGAVNLISKRPEGGDFTGEVKGSYGRFNEMSIKGAINVPLGEDGGFRISGAYGSEDGWVKNAGPGTDFGGGERYSIRAALGADLTPDLRFDMAVDYNNSSNEPLYYQSVPGFVNPAGPAPFFGAAVPQTRAGRQNTANTSFAVEEGSLETWGATTTLEWDYSDNHSVKFIGAYREAQANAFVALLPDANPFILNGIVNAPIPNVGLSVNGAFSAAAANMAAIGVPLRPGFAALFAPSAAPGPQAGLFLSPPGGANQLDDHEQYSFELTFNGNFGDGALEYTTGLFYFNEKTGNDANQARNPNDFSSLLLSLGALQPAFGVALTPVQFLSPQSPSVLGLQNALGNARNTGAAPLRISTEAFAAYGELTWNITDSLRVTGGLRYSNESKDGLGQSVSPFFFDNVDLLGRTIAPNIGAIDFDVLNPSLVVQYDVNDDVMIYASYKESFRSGGFNQSAIAPRIMGETFGADFIFGRESITAYEAGFKADLFNNRLRLNAAGFFYDFNDQQATAQTNALIATQRVVVNVDEELWGFEFDALLAVTEGLTLNATYSWIDGDAGDIQNFITGGIDVREELQGTPKNSFVVGASYDAAISDSVDIFANINYAHKDSVLAIPANDLRLTNQNLVNGRIGFDVTSAGGTQFSFSVWGENILDDEYTIESLPFETFSTRTQVFGKPATYGVSAGVKF